jgi:MarR-like DNA-binding transcriptional regulator SgrR of sgrS sRNA
MRRFISVCLALASVGLAARVVQGARPRYGGTLRVEVEATIRSLDPAAATSDVAEAAARARVVGLVFEPLVTIDEHGLKPLLATSWESDPRGARWQIRLRSGVQLHDGSTLEAWHVASALRVSEPAWTIAVESGAVVISPREPLPDLPWLLADVRHAVRVRGSGGALAGTGPFRIESREPGRLSLRAHDAYWNGRPFVDAIRIEMGRPAAAQLIDLESGHADVVAASALDARRITQRGLHIAASRPVDAIAVVFEPHRAMDTALAWRRTLSAAVNRASMSAVLLQRLAEPADALVPRWLSGYAPLFAFDRGPTLSRAAIAALPLDQRELTLRVDASDSLAHVIADRIAVDAREIGFTLKVQAPSGLAPRPDARLVRVRAPNTSPDRALAVLIERIANRDGGTVQATLPPGAALDAVYQAERQLLERSVVVPIVHLPDIYGFSDRVSTWNHPAVSESGAWNFADVWLRGGAP